MLQHILNNNEVVEDLVDKILQGIEVIKALKSDQESMTSLVDDVKAIEVHEESLNSSIKRGVFIAVKNANAKAEEHKRLENENGWWKTITHKFAKAVNNSWPHTKFFYISNFL